MKPVDQICLIENGEVGDCVRACTASILELKPEDVPHFVELEPGAAWYDTWVKFMNDHGYNPIMYEGDMTLRPRFMGYSLASGETIRGSKHMVIFWNGDLAHDPHPSRAGLKTVETLWILK